MKSHRIAVPRRRLRRNMRLHTPLSGLAHFYPTSGASTKLRHVEEAFRRTENFLFRSPDSVLEYFRLRIGSLDREVFEVAYLDAQNRLIACDREFVGTLTQTSVYPREIVKAALRYNAAAVVVAHNHPSGEPTPSRADEALTQALKAALCLVDVRLLDHLIATESRSVSMAQMALL